LSKLVFIAVGSAVGGLARYGLAGAAQRVVGAGFPIGTLAVNVLGCAAIGFLAAAFAGPWLIREEYRTAILIGVIGGFTTFSAFGFETFTLASGGQLRLAIVNLLLSNGLGLVAVWLGYRLAERWLGV
jgi:CrcB protein